MFAPRVGRVSRAILVGRTNAISTSTRIPAQCLRKPAQVQLQRLHTGGKRGADKRPMPQSRIVKELQIQQRRWASNSLSFWQNSKILWKEYPFSFTLAIITILFGMGCLVWVNYFYKSYIIGAFIAFPEPVAKHLRRALYYTNISLEPPNAVKYYKLALETANELGMDPFSDEIIGVKIQLAAMMEKAQFYGKAIEVLEIVKRDNMLWVEKLGGKEGNEGKRTRVLKKTVGISAKLGELYSNRFVQEREKAEECLIWSVETVLREKARREKEGTKEGEGEWVGDEEIGAGLEQLGNLYEEKDLHYLAAPLYLQAIALSPVGSCHTAVLMNNLSISLAQQLPPPTAHQPPISREALIDNARSWANKAIAVAARIKPPERTEECDRGCAVATHNLGEFAEMLGDVMEARKRFEEAKGLSRAIGFEEGVGEAEKGLCRLGSG